MYPKTNIHAGPYNRTRYMRNGLYISENKAFICIADIATEDGELPCGSDPGTSLMDWIAGVYRPQVDSGSMMQNHKPTLLYTRVIRVRKH